MHDANVILADLPGLGRVRLCGCENVHVSIGPVTLNLEQGAFQQLAVLMVSAVEEMAKIREAREQEPEEISMAGPLQSRLTH
jgi:hypothetical protein